MTYDKEQWGYLTSNYPGDFLFRGKILEVMSLAYKDFIDYSREEDESLQPYRIHIEATTDMQFVTIAFARDSESIAAKGGGQDIDKSATYIYNLKTCALVDKKFF